METTQLEHIFNASFHFENWKDVVRSYFKSTDFYRTPIESIDKTLKYHQVAQSIKEFGSARLADSKVIKFYNIELEDGKHVTKNRVGLRNLIHREVIPGDVDALLVVFHAPGDKDWRLTFISKSVFWDDDFSENKLETSPRRYTYILGEDESVKTAVQQFDKLEGKQITIKHLIELFNVEKLNKKFFEGYKKQYKKFWFYLANTEKYKRLFSAQNSEKQEKIIRDFTKKLLGRIVFLHFLQKKGWMGCTPHPKKWENGERQFLLKLLEGFEDKANFHSKCLTQLFFDTLNQPNRTNDAFEVAGLNNELNGTKVPYLNGGLFEIDTEVNSKSIDFPANYFEELFDFFGQYNFTIDENSPDDHEVGIDPEMLGHIFENLLEDNKDKGAFYTPKEIVQYMTQESLIQYLQTHLGEHHEIGQFIRHHDKGEEQAKHNFIRDNAERIEELLDEVKICDPAIGSGAFPMGMLHEIFKAKMALDWTLNRSEVKKNIIQNSIYGVDLESGAVDIARLRFWLALVVDEEEPHALPNLDYKIMQGNSLLESFEGIDLSEIHEGVAIEVDTEKSGANLFSQELQKKKDVNNQEKLEDLIHSYFDLDDPEAKKALHTKIDQQVLNNIYFTLHDHKADLEKEYKKLQRKIKNKSAALRTAEQKIKYETESKDAKLGKKLSAKLEAIADKQLKLKELYHSNERPFFLWHLLFKEVFDKGGFDIVIGNPPWGADIEQKELIHIKEKNRDIIRRMIDSFMFFINESLRIAKSKGVICKIIPEVILNQQDNSLLRKKILESTTIQSVANLGDNIFQGVTRASCIIQVVNEKKQDYDYSVANFTKTKSRVNFLYTDTKVASSLVRSLPNSIFPTQNLAFYRVLEKILNNETKPLLHWIDSDGIQRGVSPDLKKAFLPNKDEIKKYNLEQKFLKLTITGGKDMSKYGFEQPDKSIIYTNKQTPKSEIKNIINYLTQYKPEITCKEVAQGKHPFYALHRARNPQIFEKNSKILGVITGDRITVALDTNRIYPTDGIYLFSTGDLKKDKAIIGLLNSNLMTMIYRLYSNEQGKILAQVKPTVLQYLPIISVKKLENSILPELVSIIIFINSLKKNEINSKLFEFSNVIIELFEEIIDALVFELYFPEDFKRSGIEISKFAEQEFQSIEGLAKTEQKEIILNTYQRLTEKKNPLRNQIKLMKIELKQLLLPILSV